MGIYKKKVIAGGKTISEVEDKGINKIGIEEFPIMYAEKTIHIY